MSRKSGLEGWSPVLGPHQPLTLLQGGCAQLSLQEHTTPALPSSPTAHPGPPVFTHIVGREGGAFLQLLYQPDVWRGGLLQLCPCCHTGSPQHPWPCLAQ